ncbi:hypothetical protein UY3_09924 [Chelonia mydas]|uniref:Uncharacterized protein n=1 Tax=Chelonia mydas TaxID=8469 RepID=M7BBI1_CHEMY|nr:hypothetical protein UY3_09924 [Chelonia mydas]
MSGMEERDFTLHHGRSPERSRSGVLIQKGVLGGGGGGKVIVGGSWYSYLTFALLLAAALPSEQGSWRVAADRGEARSEGSAATNSSTEVRMAW